MTIKERLVQGFLGIITVWILILAVSLIVWGFHDYPKTTVVAGLTILGFIGGWIAD